MRTLVITEHGPPEVLKVEERPDPQPGPGEVRIRVRAAGINFADLLARMGLYQDAPKPPCVVGYEVAGEVDMVGDGVESPAVGERVLAGCRFGGYAELVVRPGQRHGAAPGRLELRGGRRAAGGVRHRVRGPDPLRLAPGGRADPDPRGRRWRGHRRDADREAGRGR